MVNFMAEITDAPKVIGELKNLKKKNEMCAVHHETSRAPG